MQVDFAQTPAKGSRRKAKPLVLDFTPTETHVYMRDRTHTYLWIRNEFSEGLFLTMDSGSIALVRLPMVVPEGQHHHVYRVFHSKEDWDDLTPFPYDFKRAVLSYHSSLLGRTSGAEAEMRKILGLEALAEGVTDAELAPQKPERKRASKVPSVPSVKQPGGYTLQALCEELKLEPTEARKALRAAKVEKPGGRWEWPSPEAAAAVRAVLEKLP